MTFRATARMTVTAVVLLAAMGACGGGAPDAELRPFAEVQEGDLVFENDPTFPGRGIFRVTTTEPMICAIAWGPTEALGNLNNSLAMSGSGIVDHDVLLPGAEPGETYHYRLQGTTADGTLYASDLATFTLPEDDTGPVTTTGSQGDNLALDATVVEVSSEFGEDWSAGNAIDGDLATEWSTAGDGDDAHLVIDLGGPEQIAGVAFLTRAMADGTATTNRFSVTVDGENRLGPFDTGNPAAPAVAEVEVTGRVLRFDVEDSTGGNTGAVEIEVRAPEPGEGGG